MGIKSSPEAVRDMKKSLQATVKSIESIQQSIKSAISASKDWNDEQGNRYRALMKRVSQLTQSPAATLKNACPKLEQLAVVLDNYHKVMK